MRAATKKSMDTSIFLARAIGVTALILYLAVLLNLPHYYKISRQIKDQPLILMLSGFVALILGLLVVLAHPLWSMDYRGLITLLGWFMIIQGTLRLAAPTFVLRMAEKMMGNKTFLVVGSVIMTLIGAFLTYKGFF